MVIIAAVTLTLAHVSYRDKTQSYVLEYGSDLLERLPMVIETMVGQGVSFEDQLRNVMPLEGYMGALCDEQGKVIWKSVQARPYELEGLCEKVRENGDPGRLALPVDLDNGKLFFAYVLPGTFNGVKGDFIALRDGAQFENWQSAAVERSLIVIILFLFGAGFLLFATFRWAMRPLKTLESELHQLDEQEKQKLTESYPWELQPVVSALNAMVSENTHRSQRYKHSLNDLAHSLKTRLAAMNVICQEATMPVQMKKEVLSNLSQMDAMVQYQLRRGLVGQAVLSKQATPLDEVVENLQVLLQKIYAEKQISFEARISKSDAVPMAKDDLMEVIGNLLDNAFRYAISKVIVSQEPLENGGVLISVEDDGPGIEQDRRVDIFQRGVRLDEKPSGQGIGLAVCADIIESYDGTVRVEESELEGARFVIELLPHDNWWQEP
ncbi:ATP-binding protein [Echinimonas agarilytica]|uniref:histidine kinase n=1 Tax=Echinimonas agarilytica TaxID=1215918 RepID=A0AA42B708_9GAMM|nr:ATP-binding protein [Echinimonas agarilytica]MCM2679344.1 ATP-binding protein [Echinimonas agarilytica]